MVVLVEGFQRIISGSAGEGFQRIISGSDHKW